MPLEDIIDPLGRTYEHASPLFDYATTFVPRRLKTFFMYCEYLYYNSPQIFSALNKFAVYPVTDFIYNTENKKLKDKHKNLFEKTLKVKSVLIQTGIDRHLYGNSFISLYFPFRRFLKCGHCGTQTNIRFVDYNVSMKNNRIEFNMMCPKCGVKKAAAKVHDEKLRLTKGISVIRWDPKYIEIDDNPITGECEYFYRIPGDFADRIQKGDKFLINTMPMAFLETVAQNKLFKFARGRIYHMKTEAPSGIDARWGLPPIISTIKSFFHTAIMKKANEAICLDHIVPFRVLHPVQSSANADPTMSISLANWVNETKLNMKAWRRDPLHLMFSPIPVGQTQIGGDGRALMVTGEIVEAENSIIAALGIPREFIYGGLTAAGSGVTLRMLENQLLSYTTQLLDEAQWISDQCSTFMGWKKIELELEPFKLIDDVQQKSMVLQTNQAMGGTLLSQTTTTQLLGYDIETERKLRMEDTINEQKFQVDLDKKMQELQNNLADRARSATQASQPQGYDQQAIIAQAEQICQQLSQMDPNSRKSYLHSLQEEDYVMYSVVIQRWEALQTQQQADMKAQMAQQGAAQGAPQ